ncbi:MAG: hypothetical protein K2P84_11845 [Undibacterium sp.]|nr:hypothetical protein [Undibacterium sp.]
MSKLSASFNTAFNLAFNICAKPFHMAWRIFVFLFFSANIHAMPAQDIRCQLKIDTHIKLGSPAILHFTLHNTSEKALRVLKWHTPFEGWMNNFLILSYNGQALPYQGAMVKRGVPNLDDYLVLAAHEKQTAEIELKLAYELKRAGRYHLQYSSKLFDVMDEKHLIKPTWETMKAQELDCSALDFELISVKP